MSARDMTLQVVVKLRDDLSRGLDGALGKLGRFAARAKGLFAGIGSAIGNLSAKIGALGIGATLGLADGLRSATEFDAKLRDVAITYGLVGTAVEDFVVKGGKATQALAKDVGQLSSKLVDVRGLLAAANVDNGAAEVMMRPIGRTSTAANADTADITKTSIAAFQNLQLPPDQLDRALAHMVVGGKLGSFELKAMSQFFPSVFAAVANLGVKGMEGVDTATAMMQISKRTAGTDGAAATNFEDFLSGLNAHHTVKRFADHGVDLPGLMANANARGINPIEAVIGKIGKMIDQPKVVDEALKRARGKGLDPTKTQEEVRKAVEQAVKAAGLGELFVNQQSKLFLMAMLANLKDYQEFKKQIGGSGTGVIDDDFKSRMAGPEGKARTAQERIEQINRRFGEALTSVYDKLGWAAEKVQGFISALDAITPKIVDTAVQLGSLAGAITGAVFALRMLGIGGGAATAGGAVLAGAGAGAGVSAAVGGGPAAGGGLLRLLAGATRAAGGIGLGATLGYGAVRLVDGIAGVAGGRYWTPQTGDDMDGLRAQLAEVEARMAALRQQSRAPEMLPTLLAPHETTAADLRQRIAAGERRGLAGSPEAPAAVGALLEAIRTALPKARPEDSRSPPPPAPQKVEVDVKATVKVDGPGQVTGTTTTTRTSGGAPDRGATVLRP